MDKNVEKYWDVRIHFTTALPPELISDLKLAAVLKKDKITYIVEKACREYITKHDLLGRDSPGTS